MRVCKKMTNVYTRLLQLCTTATTYLKVAYTQSLSSTNTNYTLCTK